MSAGKKAVWYGVRTLYRLIAEGRPKSRDKHYDREATLIEERIVLFQATSFDSAITQALKDARAYCRRTRFTNPYGQRVRMRFLGACDAFEMFDLKPAPGSEVYSSTALVRASVSDSNIVNGRMGTEPSGSKKARYKFMDGGIVEAACALQVQQSRRRLQAGSKNQRRK
jgi:hypothetical protein